MSEAETNAAESATEIAPDAVLLAARDQARVALQEITSADSIGSPDGYEVNEEHVLTLFFECRLPGYPGWRWAATLARTDADAPVTVLEVELLPGAGAVIAPEWVPWSERLAQYRDAQAKQAAEASGAGDAQESDDGDFDDDLDGDADGDVGSDGDIDGVEFDEESDGFDVDDDADDVDDDDDDDDDNADDDDAEDDDEDDDEGLGDDADVTELFAEDSDDVDSDDDGGDDADDEDGFDLGDDRSRSTETPRGSSEEE